MLRELASKFYGARKDVTRSSSVLRSSSNLCGPICLASRRSKSRANLRASRAKPRPRVVRRIRDARRSSGSSESAST